MSYRVSRMLRSLPIGNGLLKERGQSIVVITFALVGLLAMLGLVIDGGNSYLQRRRMQNAADGSAFAGAIELAKPVPPGEYPSQTEARILTRINTLAENNGVIDSNLPTGDTVDSNVVAYFVDASGNPIGLVGVQGGVPGNAKGVQVTTNDSFGTFFLGVVNETMGNAKAIAKASFAPLQSPESLSPLAAQCSGASLSSCFTFGQSYDLFNSGGPGSFGWLSWNASGNNSPYVASELDPNQNTLSDYHDPVTGCTTIAPGCWVKDAPGVTNSSDIRSQLNAWITRGQSGEPMFIPIWDISTGTGQNVKYHIVGFGAFILTDYCLPSSCSWVKGKFIKFITPGDLCTTNCYESGLNGVHLRP